MGGPAGAAVFKRIVDLEYDRLLAPLPREPVPLVGGIVGDGVGLPDAVGIAALGDHEVVVGDALGVGDRERKSLDRMADRAPHLHDGEAPLEQFVRLVGQQVAHALRTRPFGVVVVHAPHHLADFLRLAQFVVGGAQRVVEHHDAPGSALGLHQGFHLGVIGAADFGLVEEIAHPGVVAHEAEAVALEREAVRREPPVAQRHPVRVRLAAGAHVERARAAGIGEQFGAVIDNVVERRLDRVGDGGKLGGHAHGGNSLTAVRSVLRK